MFCFLCGFTQGYSSTWRMGTARVDITPRDSLWMGGYAARTRPAVKAMHPLWAKAVVIADENDYRGILITTDLLGFPADLSKSIRDEICERLGVEYSQIILSSSHTHSGPVLRKGLMDIYPLQRSHLEEVIAYSDKLHTKIVDLVQEAWFDLHPVSLSSTNGVVRFQVNRRNNNARDLHLASDLNGPNDFSVPVLVAIGEDSSLHATVFGYACHPTVLNSYEWSGDYPGFAQIELERSFPEMTALFFQGCGADQNPLPRRSRSLAEQYGKELAASVTRCLHEGGRDLEASLRTGYAEIELGLNAVPDTATLAEIIENGSSYQVRWAQRMLKEVTAGKDIPKSYRYPIQIWKMGSQLLCVMGGEVVVDYAIHLKRLFGEETFVMGYANDVMAYIPTVHILCEGGYEGVSSQMVYGLPSTWQADIEQNILHGFLQLARSMQLSLAEAPLWQH